MAIKCFKELLTKSASLFFNKQKHIIIGFMMGRKGIKRCAIGRYWVHPKLSLLISLCGWWGFRPRRSALAGVTISQLQFEIHHRYSNSIK